MTFSSEIQRIVYEAEQDHKKIIDKKKVKDNFPKNKEETVEKCMMDAVDRKILES